MTALPEGDLAAARGVPGGAGAAGVPETGDRPDQPVRLSIPAAPRFLRLARLTAAGIAGDLGFTLEEIEDLRIAVDEVCAVLIEDAPDGTTLELEYRSSLGVLEVQGRCPSASGAPPELHAVARELLVITADDYEVDAADGARFFRLHKRSAERSP